MYNENLLSSWDDITETRLQKCKYGSCKLLVGDDGFNDTYALKSYNTVVETVTAYFDGSYKYTFTGTYSATTMRHMRAFSAEMASKGIYLPNYFSMRKICNRLHECPVSVFSDDGRVWETATYTDSADGEKFSFVADGCGTPCERVTRIDITVPKEV